MSAKSLHQKILAALQARGVWEQRQRVWYQMRHDGLRRKNKPFPGAADLHFPLIDKTIEKLKPFYFNQIFAADKLAQFVSLKGESAMAATADSAAEFFDWKVRSETDFEDEAQSMIDTMLLRGKGVLKWRWDVLQQRLVCEAIDPLFLIVPKNTAKLKDADWVCHVKQVSVDEFLRDERYQCDADTLKLIRGRGQVPNDQTQATEEKFQREGITYCEDDDMVVVWEVWQKTKGGWTIYTYNPMQPGRPLRPAFGCPYVWDGKPLFPFVEWSCEIKDKGFYASRGIAERLAPYESSLCKMWNEKHDAMTFLNRPQYKATEELRNTANISLTPGTLLPKGVEPVRLTEIPFSFDQEMNSTQNLADQTIAVPDAGIQPQQVGEKKSQFATATQINFQQALAGTGVDFKGRTFRRPLAECYTVAWALLSQYAKGELVYLMSGDVKKLPEQVLKDTYMITPDGTDWNKQQRQQRAFGRFQLFNGDQFIDQEELRKDVLEADDGRLVKKLLVPQEVKAGNEQEDEAMEIILLMNGYPAQAKPNEDHALRIQILLGKLEQLGATGQPVDEQARNLMQQHLLQHLTFLKEQNPDAAKEIEASLGGAPNPRDAGATRVMEQQEVAL